MKRSLSAIGVCAVIFAFVLSGCTSSTDTGQQQASTDSESSTATEYSEDLRDFSIYFLSDMKLSVPSSWDVERDGSSSITMRPPVGGLAMVSVSDGIDFVDDGSGEVDVLIDTLDGDVTKVTSEKEKGTISSAVSYIVDIERSEDGVPYKGHALFVANGHSLYSFIMCVPEEDYDNGYDKVLDEVVDRVAINGSSKPLGAETKTEDITTTSSPTTSPVESTTLSEGTYKVGTDIEPGEYKLTATTSVPGYWEVTNSSSPDADIVGNDNFNGNAYVTVSEGQYLTLNRCKAEKVG